MNKWKNSTLRKLLQIFFQRLDFLLHILEGLKHIKQANKRKNDFMKILQWCYFLTCAGTKIYRCLQHSEVQIMCHCLTSHLEL